MYVCLREREDLNILESLAFKDVSGDGICESRMTLLMVVVTNMQEDMKEVSAESE